MRKILNNFVKGAKGFLTVLAGSALLYSSGCFNSLKPPEYHPEYYRYTKPSSASFESKTSSVLEPKVYPSPNLKDYKTLANILEEVCDIGYGVSKQGFYCEKNIGGKHRTTKIYFKELKKITAKCPSQCAPQDICDLFFTLQSDREVKMPNFAGCDKTYEFTSRIYSICTSK